jgi:hypothetical protein
VQNLEDFELEHLDNGVLVSAGVKHGFCFFDNYRYTSSNPAYYTASNGACGKNLLPTLIRA